VGEARGTAPRTHFINRTTTEKLAGVLDAAEQLGIDFYPPYFCGGRDWVVISHGAPIPGPAGRRIFKPREE
jgi:hypothetical protein